ncbi:hypothetical protein CWS02_00555 [Enterobacter sp. EA-1]|nr:hypothetical protein CWS02_00555 [Enterobacter sp. EA-1]
MFQASIYLVLPSGDRSLLAEQALFSGDGAPQMQPLTIAPLPIWTHRQVVTAFAELSGSDFHHQRASDPTGKMRPTPQVSRIDTEFTQTVTLEQIIGRTALLRAGEITEQAICRFEVIAGDSVSIYWAMQSLSSLALNWYCYTSEGTWQALDATLNDATGGPRRSVGCGRRSCPAMLRWAVTGYPKRTTG